MNSLMFTEESTYYHRCGGLTHEIANLCNKDCQDYHKLFYSPENMLVIVTGDQIDETLLQILDDIPCLNKKSKGEGLQEFEIKFRDIPQEGLQQKVMFPSGDTDQGSIAFGRFLYQAK